MNRKNIGIMIFMLLVLWIGLIFYFSSQPPVVSHGQSGLAIKVFKKVNDVFDITDTHIFKNLESIVKDKLLKGKYKSTNYMLRRSAHFGIYFILGIMCSVFGYFYTKKILIGFLLGVSLPVVVAVLDEFNQGFVGRTSSLSDVILDGTGALIGTGIVVLIILIIRLVRKMTIRQK